MTCFCKLMAQNWHKNFALMRTWNWPMRCLFNLPLLNDHATIDQSGCLEHILLGNFENLCPWRNSVLSLKLTNCCRYSSQQIMVCWIWIGSRSFYRIIVYIKTVFYISLQSGHPAPLPYPIECKHLDYGLQHKIAIKPIFTLFFTNKVVESVWLWRISGRIRRDDVGNKFSQEWHNKIVLRSRVSYLTNHF